MRTVETTGRTLEEAKQQAMDELGVTDESLLDIEILEEGGRSLFGVKQAQVKVRVMMKDDEKASNMLADSGVTEDELGQEPDAETTRKVLDLVNRVVNLSGFRVDVRHRGNQGRYVQIEFMGRDALYMVNRHGELLDALQYLTNLLIGKQIDQTTRVILDAQNYRRRRAENLRNLAVSLAVQVKERQEEAELDPLPAHERRIIHRALLNDDGVETYSEGEEPNRYVVISPKKRS